MELTEFVENVSGMKLTVYQKRMLELLDNLPKKQLHCYGKRIDHAKESYERNIINCKK